MGKERKRLRGDYHGYLNGSEKFGFDNKYSIKDGVLFVEVIFKDSLNIYEFDIDFLKTLQSINNKIPAKQQYKHCLYIPLKPES